MRPCIHVDSDESQADAGVSGRRFDDRATGLETSTLFCAQDDPACGSIFYAPAGIQIFQLGIDVSSVVGSELFELEDGGLTNERGDVFGHSQARGLVSSHYRVRKGRRRRQLCSWSVAV